MFLLEEKHADGTSIDIAIHVDDGLVSTDTLPRLESLLSTLEDKFQIIKTMRGIQDEYLSMVSDFNHESRIVSITMPKYATKILDDYLLKQYKTVQTSHNLELFKINESSRLSKEDQKVFHRTVMMILYNAARI